MSFKALPRRETRAGDGRTPSLALREPLTYDEQRRVRQLQIWLRCVKTCARCLKPKLINRFDWNRPICDDCRLSRFTRPARGSASR